MTPTEALATLRRLAEWAQSSGDTAHERALLLYAYRTDFPALAEAVEKEINPPVVDDNHVGSTITAAFEDGSYRITSKAGQVRRVTFFRSLNELRLSDQLAAANAEITRLRELVGELEGQHVSRCPLCDEPTIDGAELCEDCADDESEGDDAQE